MHPILWRDLPDDIIAVAVRWYLQLRLPYADVVVLLAERGVHVDRTTVFDWVQRFAPLYIEVAPQAPARRETMVDR
jgi:transposase-like protein